MNNSNKSNRRALIIITVIIILAIIAALIIFNIDTNTYKSYSEFWDYLEQGKVKEITFSDSYTMKVVIEENEKKSAFITYVPSRTTADSIFEYCSEKGIDKPSVTMNNPNEGTSISTILSIVSFVIIAILAIIFIISMRKSGGGGNNAFNFGKTKTRVTADTKVRFSDVAGAEEEKLELREIVDFLKDPKKFTEIGAKIPRGVLLVGPPGTGKTLFAKEVAGESNVPFFSISGSDFVEMFVGVGASRVRDLFAQAKRSQPCIVFIDEIDAVGRQRGAGLGGGNDEREQTLNQLLVQMDGFEPNDGIIVMAATNRVDILDPALMRPGRFDRQIFVNTPDVKGREEIFKVHARNKPISGDVNFRTLARITSGFSGADIANVLNEAAILAARHNRKIILMEDITEGINKVIAGPQKKSRVITETDKRITAYHESGHAIVGKLMKHCDAVQEVSIIPRGMAAGYTISIPKNDNSHVTKNKLNDEIAMLLGGRAAEEIVIQDISTGASNDIERATQLARKMVTEWGMSDKLPNLFYGASQEVFLGRDYQQQVSYGDDVAAIIDQEVQKIITENYARALEVLKAHRDVLDAMVKLLYSKETIYSDEVDMLMDGKSIEEINEYISEKQKKHEEESKKYSAPVVTPVFKPASDYIVKEDKPSTEQESTDEPTDTKPEEPVSEEPTTVENKDIPTEDSDKDKPQD